MSPSLRPKKKAKKATKRPSSPPPSTPSFLLKEVFDKLVAFISLDPFVNGDIPLQFKIMPPDLTTTQELVSCPAPTKDTFDSRSRRFYTPVKTSDVLTAKVVHGLACIRSGSLPPANLEHAGSPIEFTIVGDNDPLVWAVFWNGRHLAIRSKLDVDVKTQINRSTPDATISVLRELCVMVNGAKTVHDLVTLLKGMVITKVISGRDLTNQHTMDALWRFTRWVEWIANVSTFKINVSDGVTFYNDVKTPGSINTDVFLKADGSEDTDVSLFVQDSDAPEACVGCFTNVSINDPHHVLSCGHFLHTKHGGSSSGSKCPLRCDELKGKMVKKCLVCQDEFAAQDPHCRLLCGHLLHTECFHNLTMHGHTQCPARCGDLVKASLGNLASGSMTFTPTMERLEGEHVAHVSPSKSELATAIDTTISYPAGYTSFLSEDPCELDDRVWGHRNDTTTDCKVPNTKAGRRLVDGMLTLTSTCLQGIVTDNYGFASVHLKTGVPGHDFPDSGYLTFALQALRSILRSF
jgi:hypothetical protein